MKKLILLLLLFIGYSEVFSQYTPMLQENAEWYHYFSEFVSFNQTFTIEGDSVLNGVTYKKFSSTYPDYEYGIKLLREDTVAKKVFKVLFDGVEGLIYDFSALPGEEVVVNSFYSNNNETLLLDSITDYFPYSYFELPENPKVFYFSYNNAQTVWIEGIGSIRDPLYSDQIWDYGRGLLCHYNNDGVKDFSNNYLQIEYPQVEECLGWESDNVQELGNSNNLIIFPVPASNTLNLKHLQNKRIIKVKILDLSGKLILNENRVNSFQADVNVSNLASGSYFIDVEFENEERVVKGFVKE